MTIEASASPLPPYTSGVLARLAGVNLETLRYYERKGLLPQPPRTSSGYRAYPREALRRLQFIKGAQELGFTLGEVKDLLSIRLDPAGTCQDVSGRVTAKLNDIDRKIAPLRTIRSELKSLLSACPGDIAAAHCTLLGALDSQGGVGESQ